MPESVTDIVLESLADYFKANIQGVRQVIHGFPEANINMSFPSVSVLIKSAPYKNIPPYEYSKGAVASNAAKVKWVIGQHDFTFQVDLWERTREEVDDLYEKFIQAMNPDIPERLGIVLPLTKYHGNTCEYTMTRTEPKTSSGDSTTKQWRISVDLVGNCLVILEKSQYIITQMQVTQQVGSGSIDDMGSNEEELKTIF